MLALPFVIKTLFPCAAKEVGGDQGDTQIPYHQIIKGREGEIKFATSNSE